MLSKEDDGLETIATVLTVVMTHFVVDQTFYLSCWQLYMLFVDSTYMCLVVAVLFTLWL